MAQVPYATWAEIEAKLAERQVALEAEVDARIAAAVAPINEALVDVVHFKDPVSLKMNGGQFLSPKDGGPTEPEQPVALVSKADNNAWETYKLVKGQ